MAVTTREYNLLFGQFDGIGGSYSMQESGELPPLSGPGAAPTTADPSELGAPLSAAHRRSGRSPHSRRGPATPHVSHPAPRARAAQGATPHRVSPVTPHASGAHPSPARPVSHGATPRPTAPITPSQPAPASGQPASSAPSPPASSPAPVKWADPGKINYGADAARLSGAPAGSTTPKAVGGATPASAPAPTTPKPVTTTPAAPPAHATPSAAAPQATRTGMAPVTPAGPAAPATPAPPPASSVKNPYFTRENAEALKESAARLGTSPEALATAIAYETEGTFSPKIWGGAGGQFMGLIQFGGGGWRGHWEREKYGANEKQSFKEQLPAVEAYLKDRGFKPGMGLLDLYSTINAGSPGKYNLSDDGGRHTVRTHVAQMQRDVGGLAREFLDSGSAEARQTMTPKPAVAPAAFIGDSLAHGLRGAARGFGDTQIRRPPQEVLGAIKRLPEGALSGRPVVISSGASNAPTQAGMLSEQIEAAKAKGAEPSRITVLGVGPRSDFKGVNERLKDIATQSGARFQPLLETDRGLVHPKDYGALLRALGTDKASDGRTPTAPPAKKRVKKFVMFDAETPGHIWVDE